MEKNKVTMEKIVNLCKTRGFVFPGSEIYDGFANTWDFGPLGVELENNVKRAWWKFFVQKDRNTYGLDASILMNPRVWEASGHVQNFGDPKMDCKNCKQRFRADTLVDDFSKGEAHAEGMSNEELENYVAFIRKNPKYSKLTKRHFISAIKYYAIPIIYKYDFKD